ncbi:MAG: hypothetical protein RLN72_08520 [Henriciella sp.]
MDYVLIRIDPAAGSPQAAEVKPEFFMSFKQIILRLARNPGFPEGDGDRGYVVIAPLTADGHLDLEAWRKDREKATVVRFDPNSEERADGWLTHRGSHWYFHYDEDDEGPDEPAHRLDNHLFKVGEYVTIRHHGEEPLTYRVSDVG